MIQPPLETSNLLISRAYEKKIDSSVTKYLISEILPHVHVESSGFTQFMHVVFPGYELKSTRTIKRSILQMYVVVRLLVISFLSEQASHFAITFDGWSNNSLKDLSRDFTLSLFRVC